MTTKKLGNYKTTTNLSSQTLFHFTNEINKLGLILTNGFQVRNIYEKLPGRQIGYITKAICFCDIPLSLIKEHVNWYGSYGIGISRNYAKNRNFTPVHYIHKESSLYPKGSSEHSIEWFTNYPFTPYLKQIYGYQHILNNKNITVGKGKKFYNEREWRYIPTENKMEVLKHNLEKELETRTDELNREILPLMDLDSSCIEYILINKTEELDQLKEIFKLPKYKNNYELLLTKVLIFNQIKNDL